MTVKATADTDNDSAPRTSPWPDGPEARRLLSRRIRVCSQRHDRAWDLLVSASACRCGRLQPRIQFLELTGMGAQSLRELETLATHAISLPPPQTCSHCGARVDPEEAIRRILFTYAHNVGADLVTVWNGEIVTSFVWSHENGSLRSLDGLAGAPNKDNRKAVEILDPFLTASSFRSALGQTNFNRPETPAALQSCLRKHPNFLPAIELTAQIRLAQGDYRGAEVLFRRLVRQQPEQEDSWYALGICLMEMARSAPPEDRPRLAEMAGRSLLEAEERSPSPKAAHFRALGSLLLMVGQNEAAADQLDTALSLEPGRYETVLHLGMAHLRSGRADKALAMLEIAASDRPNDPVTALWLADCLLELGMVERARKQLQVCRNLGAPAGRIEVLEAKHAIRGTKS